MKSNSGFLNARIREILEFGHLLVTTLDFSEVMDLILQKICNIFNAETSSLLLVDPETEDLVFQVALGDAGSVVKQFRLKKGEGFAGNVVETGEALIIKDARQDLRHMKAVDTESHFVTHSMLVVPLKIRGSIIGVIEVINSLSKEFDQDDLQLLELLAPFAAAALQNSKYSQHLEKMVSDRTRELELSNKRLMEIDSAKSEFLSTAAHEMKTPLGAVRLFLSLLQDGSLGSINEEQKEVLTDCVESINRLLRMILSLLNLAKIEAGVVELCVEQLKVEDQLAKAVRFLEPDAKKNGIIISMSNDSEFVIADPDKFQQIIINLVGNAIKFTPQGGKVSVNATDCEGFVRFSIADTGPGMTPEQLSRLFVRFHRITDGSAKKISGTGLGLTISKSLIEQQGGRIQVMSEPGKGSMFEFYLPIWDNTKAKEVKDTLTGR